MYKRCLYLCCDWREQWEKIHTASNRWASIWVRGLDETLKKLTSCEKKYPKIFIWQAIVRGRLFLQRVFLFWVDEYTAINISGKFLLIIYFYQHVIAFGGCFLNPNLKFLKSQNRQFSSSHISKSAIAFLTQISNSQNPKISNFLLLTSQNPSIAKSAI